MTVPSAKVVKCAYIVQYSHLCITMNWYQEAADEEEEDLMFSPALLARRASESWIIAPPVEVCNALDDDDDVYVVFA